MERRGFLKRLFGLGVGAAAMTVPGLAKAASKDTFTIEDNFIQCDGNSNIYVIKKDSLLNKELMKAIGDHYLPKDKFGCYYPMHNHYIPIKDSYTVEDFNQLIMFLKDMRGHFRYFTDGQYRDNEVGLLELFKNEKGGYYQPEFFEAFKHGQYGPKD